MQAVWVIGTPCDGPPDRPNAAPARGAEAALAKGAKAVASERADAAVRGEAGIGVSGAKEAAARAVTEIGNPETAETALNGRETALEGRETVALGGGIVALSIVNGRIYDLGGVLGRAQAERTVVLPPETRLCPGRLYDGPLWARGDEPAAFLAGRAEPLGLKVYREAMAGLAREGYTAFVDWVPVSAPEELPAAVRQVAARHALSPFDFTLKPVMAASKLFGRRGERLIRALRDLGLLEAVIAVDAPPPGGRFFHDLRDRLDGFPLRVTLFLLAEGRDEAVDGAAADWYHGFRGAGIYVRTFFSSAIGRTAGGWRWSGLYGPKGRLAPGADADFALVRPDGTAEVWVRGMDDPASPLPFGRGRFLKPRATFAPEAFLCPGQLRQRMGV
ncbi:hypothetical protein [Hydrogenibacillus sp. N12]|uniref:hypothetical protein n=1 Tax=Hydrogenibacillus sp. N12 TaxID=2866627 RepID=UPI001C7D250C|nr:hypothetical protein [Hydrogenibacillus sp. N12]QZA33787.1 hypothetical protein K2M58_04540 [Hydrogenibacillus sp. N12]